MMEMMNKWWFWAMACLMIIFVSSLIYGYVTEDTVTLDEYNELWFKSCELDNTWAEYSNTLLEQLRGYDEAYYSIDYIEGMEC